MVNALHSRLEAFLAPFNGVSTRRLPLYLSCSSNSYVTETCLAFGEVRAARRPVGFR